MRLSTLALVFTALLFVLGGAARGQALGMLPSDLDVRPSAAELEVVRLVNVERVKAGLWPLAVNTALTASAREHNADMISNRYFGHTGSDGSSPADRAAALGFQQYGWGAAYVGENIAAGYASPAAVLQGWMASEGHRANILKPEYREIGLGYTSNPSCSPYCTYWTQVFGSQPKVLPVFINDGSEEVNYTNVRITLTNETVSNWGSIGQVKEIMLASDPNFAGSSWRPYTQQTAYNLPPGDGARTVYVRMRDAAGLEVRSTDSVTVESIAVEYKYKVYVPAVVRP